MYSIWRYLAGVQEPPCPRLLHHALELCVVPRVARVPDLQVVAALSRDRVHAAITNIFDIIFLFVRFLVPPLAKTWARWRCRMVHLCSAERQLWQWMLYFKFHASRSYWNANNRPGAGGEFFMENLKIPNVNIMRQLMISVIARNWVQTLAPVWCLYKIDRFRSF